MTTRTDSPESGVYDEHGWLQTRVRALGSYAQSSTPAYVLSGLFLLSTPLGFASPVQAAAEAAARLRYKQQLFETAQALRLANGSAPSSSLLTRLVASQKVRKAQGKAALPMRAVAPYWQLAFLSVAFATGGYVIDQNDVLNGSGIVTAWSISYLLFRTIPTLRQLPRNPWALTLSAAVLSLGLGVHGSHYFDKTSWRGAVPLFADYSPNQSASSSYSRDTSTNLRPVTKQSDITTHTSHLPAKNNDSARAAAFLSRQRQSLY